MKRELGGLTIEIIEGDITQADTDAIVNAANNHLWMGAGVAGAIKRAGGSQVEREAVARGPIDIGGAVETTAGELPHKCVIHGAVMGQDLRTDEGLIAQTTRSSLELADDLGLSSVALPAFGTGVGGFPIDDCAAIMAGEVAKFVEHAKNLTRVVFVLYGDAAHRAFAAGAGRMLSE